MDPINYSAMLQQVNPAQSLMQGLQVGSALSDIRLKQQQKEAAQARMQQYSADLQAAFARPTPEAFAMLAAKYPEQREAFKQSWDTLSQGEKNAQFTVGTQAYNAVMSGNVDAAKSLLSDQVEAYKNSGKDYRGIESMLSALDTDPQNVASHLGLALSAVDPERWNKMTEGLRAQQKAPSEVRKLEAEAATKEAEAASAADKYGADIGLTKAQREQALASARKLDAETQKLLLDLKNAKDGKIQIEPEKKFDLENKLREQYVNRTKNFIAAKDAHAKIKTSADDKSGAGDIALVTSFMKMLDPGSVVRETEFATARDTAGLLTQLQNMASKYSGGSFLSDKQRADFKRLASQYMAAAVAQEKNVRAGLMKPVNEYGLSADSVFGEIPAEETAAPQQRKAEDYGVTVAKPAQKPAAPKAPATKTILVDY